MAWSPLAGGRVVSADAAAKDVRVSRVQSALQKVAKQLGSDVTADMVYLFFIFLLKYKI
jgi:predicted oxidoreductase